VIRRRVHTRLGGRLGCYAAALGLLATGCALAPDENSAFKAADAFAQAVSEGDGETACALLIQSAVEEVERSEGEACRQAVLSLNLPGPGHRESVDVYGTNARVVTDTDVVFLSDSEGGWKVTAAGCDGASGDQPYSCTVAAG
jgi:hypothetical protein